MISEVLTINVTITGVDEVKGRTGKGVMLHFDGTADCPNFKGKTLPGGADTQKTKYGEKKQLSARYIMEGTDAEGVPCRIFIENNGEACEDEQFITTPVIYTDSEALSWLEDADLCGTIEPAEGGVVIHIFAGQE